MTTADLLEKWREATRATELAKRLAEAALEAVHQAEESAAVADEIATLAERAASAAQETAETARRAADDAARLAVGERAGVLSDAKHAVEATEIEEHDAADRFHDAESGARDRQD